MVAMNTRKLKKLAKFIWLHEIQLGNLLGNQFMRFRNNFTVIFLALTCAKFKDLIYSLKKNGHLGTCCPEFSLYGFIENFEYHLLKDLS